MTRVSFGEFCQRTMSTPPKHLLSPTLRPASKFGCLKIVDKFMTKDSKYCSSTGGACCVIVEKLHTGEKQN